MARYDFGLRGPRDTQDPRYHDWSRASRSESEHPHRQIEDQEPAAREERGYSRPTGDRYPRSTYPNAADLSGRSPRDGERRRSDAIRDRR